MATRSKNARTDNAARPPGSSAARAGGGKASSRNRGARPRSTGEEQEMSQPQARAASPKGNPDQRRPAQPASDAALRRGLATTARAVSRSVTGVAGTAARSVTSAAQSVAGAASTAVDGVRSNPIPAALVGAGIAWLVLDQMNRRTRFVARARDAVTDAVGQPLATAYEAVTETFGDTAATAREAAAAAYETVRDGAARLGQYAAVGASAAGEGARSAYTSGQRAVARTWQEYPLVVGLATLAAGVAAGLLLPRTRRETELMGETAAEIANRVRTTGRQLVQRGKKAAATAAQATAREARRVGLAPDEIGRKIKRIATTARDAVTEGASEE